jgi:hypothetical protein
MIMSFQESNETDKLKTLEAQLITWLFIFKFVFNVQ